MDRDELWQERWLRERLKRAVAKERYEEAARLRDRLRALQDGPALITPSTGLADLPPDALPRDHRTALHEAMRRWRPEVDAALRSILQYRTRPQLITHELKRNIVRVITVAESREEHVWRDRVVLVVHYPDDPNVPPSMEEPHP